jgi:cell division protein ZapA (FtsZ GTPase activity inhibitor)
LADKEKKTLEIRVFGNSLKIVTDENEEYVYKIVSFLNKKMEEISRNLKIASNAERMTLVALSVTDELFKLKEKKEDALLDNVNYSGIINMIDEALSG